MTTWEPVAVTLTAPAWVPAWPTVPPSEDDPITDPTALDRVQLAVSSIRDFAWRGEILQATVESWSETLDGHGGGGGGEIQFSVPVTDVSLISTLLTDVEDWGPLGTTGVLHVVDRAVHVVVDGHVTGSYVLRSEARVDAQRGLVTFQGQAAARLFADRIIGYGLRKDFLNGRGSFPGSGSLSSLGFTWTGSPGDLGWVDGVRSGRAVSIEGDPLTNRLRISTVITEGPPTPGGTGMNVPIRASAFFRLPDDVIDGTSIMWLEVYDHATGTQLWPSPGAGNPGAVQVDEDMPRGEWDRSPLSAVAVLPKPPYSARVVLTIAPAYETGQTWVDEIRIFRRDTLATGVERDLTDHLLILLRDAQEAWKKSSWSLPIVRGTSTGVSELGVWRRDDDQPLADGIAALTGRRDGPDPPWVRPDWRIEVAARRGQVRPALILGPDDVLDDPGWTHDAGSQVSEVRAVTDRGSDYWRVQSIQTDTSSTDGHVIEQIVRAPNHLSLAATDRWAQAELASLAQPQVTTRVLVSWETGRRIAVGDSFWWVSVAGVLRESRWVRCFGKTWMPGPRVVALDLGADADSEPEE